MKTVSLVVLACFATVALAQAKFGPACLKRDGDWVHGLSKKECLQLRGKWRRS